MERRDNFYTLKGYSLLEHVSITSSMEDYLEMICRLCGTTSSVRISDLANRLHVRPPSASKMAGNLRNQGLIRFERYGTITPTEAGIELGQYLLFRHQVLHDFFCFINESDDELELVEKVEHFLNPQTIYNLQKWLDRFNR